MGERCESARGEAERELDAIAGRLAGLFATLNEFPSIRCGALGGGPQRAGQSAVKGRAKEHKGFALALNFVAEQGLFLTVDEPLVDWMGAVTCRLRRQAARLELPLLPAVRPSLYPSWSVRVRAKLN
jgi:hypothetical protein